MSDEISQELFARLVELAALELSPNEGEYLRMQLNNQLKAIHELESIPLDQSTPIASHGIQYSVESSADIREDLAKPYPNPEGLLLGAPEVDHQYIIVPEIPHQNLK
jgi:aspartyl-tRNA(Asn)/glutamyl-tRNA(Gln) amidotransferase subunit C